MEDYKKAPLTYDQQVNLLQSRGLVINNSSYAIKFLQQINYYRFSAYCIPFQTSRDVFSPGITFDKIAELYLLDEELRNNFLAMLSPIEIFLRTRIVYEFGHDLGAFAHCDSASFRDGFKHDEWLASLDEEVNRGKETFLEHYKGKYNGFPRLPLWIACEIMSLGSLSFLYRGLLPALKHRISSALEIHPVVLESWLHHITYLRNTCAHHGRLWNREFAIKPLLPDKDKQWTTIRFDNRHLFTSIAIGEWICHKAQLPGCNIEQVYEIMRKISTMDARFARMMGVPDRRAIGMCWETNK